LLLERIERWYDRVGKKLMKAIYILLGVVVVYFFFKYIFELVLPFIIAWILASLLNPVVTFLAKHFKIPRGIGTLVSMVTVLSAVFGMIAFLVKQLWDQIVGFTIAFPNYKLEMMLVLDDIQVQFQGIMDKLPLPEAFQSLDDVINTVLNNIGGFLTGLVEGTYNVVIKVPNGLFFVIVVLIAVFFMTKDYKMIGQFVKAQVPEKVVSKSILMKDGLKEALGGYVKTQLILMCFTFTICLVGLFVLQRPYALLIAIGIAFFDALPMFGSGAVLIPWAIFQLISGNIVVAVGLLAIYGLIVVVRQVLEPKVLSSQIGVYALVTLMSMYIGFKLIGVIGLILGPVTMVMLKTLQAIGLISSFKKVEDLYNNEEIK
jgi:sporulation integral membrane protein YtvI